MEESDSRKGIIVKGLALNATQSPDSVTIWKQSESISRAAVGERSQDELRVWETPSRLFKHSQRLSPRSRTA